MTNAKNVATMKKNYFDFFAVWIIDFHCPEAKKHTSPKTFLFDREKIIIPTNEIKREDVIFLWNLSEL